MLPVTPATTELDLQSSCLNPYFSGVWEQYSGQGGTTIGRTQQLSSHAHPGEQTGIPRGAFLMSLFSPLDRGGYLGEKGA